MIVNIEQDSRRKLLNISYFDESGKVKIKKVTIPEEEFYSWKECKDNDKKADQTVKAWNGKSVKKSPAKTLNKHRLYEFVSSLPKEEQDELFALNYPSVGFVDIEVRVPEGGVKSFESWCSEVPSEILTISVVTQTGKAIVMGMKDLTIRDEGEIEKNINEEFSKINYSCKFKYLKYDNEVELLHAFFKKIVPSFGMLTGWNFINFDWTYLMNRFKRLGGDPSIASPTRTLNYKETIPSHVAVFDYASIFARWDRSIKVKENNTLDFVSKSMLGINKVFHSESLNELYDKDFKRYVWYNVVDSILVHQIDERCKLLDLLFTISNLCKITIYQADMPTVIGDALLTAGFKKRNLVTTKGFDRPPGDSSRYEGAYVKSPIPGYYEWVAAFDFASLYPTTMRQFNISPESYIEKLETKIPSSVWDSLTKDEKKKKFEERAAKERELNDPDRIICDNGVVFSKEDSTLKEILTDLYNQRKIYKKQMLERKQQISKLKKEIAELEKEI